MSLEPDPRPPWLTRLLSLLLLVLWLSVALIVLLGTTVAILWLGVLLLGP